MPQRQFWTTRHPVCFASSYTVDLTVPNAPPKLFLGVYDQERTLMANCNLMVPPTFVDEAVPALFDVGWSCYLYGDPEQELKTVMTRTAREWWDHADRQTQHR